MDGFEQVSEKLENGSMNENDRAFDIDPFSEVASELARILYEADERLDPGTHDVEWVHAHPGVKSLYIERIHAILSHRDLVMRFFELSDSDSV